MRVPSVCSTPGRPTWLGARRTPPTLRTGTTSCAPRPRAECAHNPTWQRRRLQRSRPLSALSAGSLAVFLPPSPCVASSSQGSRIQVGLVENRSGLSSLLIVMRKPLPCRHRRFAPPRHPPPPPASGHGRHCSEHIGDQPQCGLAPIDVLQQCE